jgi:hypothetical protein
MGDKRIINIINIIIRICINFKFHKKITCLKKFIKIQKYDLYF